VKKNEKENVVNFSSIGLLSISKASSLGQVYHTSPQMLSDIRNCKIKPKERKRKEKEENVMLKN